MAKQIKPTAAQLAQQARTDAKNQQKALNDAQTKARKAMAKNPDFKNLSRSEQETALNKLAKGVLKGIFHGNRN